MRRLVGLIYRKEMRETLRDRRTLVVMILLPLALYPLVGVGVSQWVGLQESVQEEQPSRLGLLGPSWPDLEAALERSGRIQIVRPPSSPAASRPAIPAATAAARPGELSRREAEVRQGALDGALILPENLHQALRSGGTAELDLLYDETHHRSTRARQRVRAALRALDTELRAQRLAERDLPPSFAQPLHTRERGMASSRERGAHLLAGVLPLLVVLMVLLGAFYPAIDLTAGEKERGTLETLLATPVPRTAIITGKFLVVATVATVTGLLNLGSIGLTLGLGFGPAFRAAGLAADIPWSAVALTAVALLPAALFFAALMVAVAALARSFKEAQNLLTPVYLACMVPALLAGLPGIELTPWTALIPVGNVALLTRELIAGRLAAIPSLLALGSTLLYTIVALRLAARIYHSERLLFAVEGQRRTRAAPARTTPSGAEAAGALVLVMALIVLLGRHLQGANFIVGILITEWGMIALPVLVILRLGALAPRPVLHLRPARPLALLGAGLAGISAWFLVSVLVEGLQQRVLPIPPALEAEMRRLFLGTERSVVVDLLALALSPAICEELLFRGLILRASLGALRPGGAVLLNGLLFGLFHLSVYRFFPTALLGMVLALLVVRTGSLYPAVLFHLLNNAAALLVGRLLSGEAESRLGFSWATVLLAVAATAIFLLGLVLARDRQARQTDGPSGGASPAG